MNTKTSLIIVVIAVAVFGLVFYTQNMQEQSAPELPTNNSQDTLPQTHPMITVYTPQPNEQVASPLLVAGEARGNWYFEASFPVKLYDANNILLATGVAQALADWMTTDFVAFTVTLNFATPSTSTGTLVLEKDNPSGLPQNDDSISVPVSF